QWRFAIAPTAAVALEVLDEVLAPALLADGSIETDEVAVEAQRIDALTIDGRAAARSGMASPVGANRPDLGGPELLAGLLAQGDHVFLPVAVAHREDAASGNRGRAVVLAHALGLPELFRAVGGPLLQESCLARQGSPLWPLPLRPVERPRTKRWFVCGKNGQRDRQQRQDRKQTFPHGRTPKIDSSNRRTQTGRHAGGGNRSGGKVGGRRMPVAIL